MKIRRVTITNLRALDYAQFEFDPQFTLIVGVNGVGKSTIIEALRICLSRILPHVTPSQSKAMSFSMEDIRIGSGIPFLDVVIQFEHDNQDFRYTRREWREKFAEDDEENIEKLERLIRDSERLSDRPRTLLRELVDTHRVYDTDVFMPSQSDLRKTKLTSRVATNGIFFSTNRSAVSHVRTSKAKAAGEKAAAYAEALSDRPLYLVQFAEWMRVQDELAGERPLSARHLEVLRTAVNRFLPGFENLRPDFSDRPRLIIDKNGVTLDVRQLSDGERSVLALVLDIARRLSQANPTLADPVRDGEAIVLIDEIDLHLHPTWQRQIVRNLTAAFPKCQFIATTHSPQVIGEVAPDRIQIISDGQVYTPSHSFGVDSSRILEEIMDTPPRNESVQSLLLRVSQAIGEDEPEHARVLVNEIAAQVGEADADVIRVRTLLKFLEGEG